MSNLRIIKSYTTSERARLELIQAVYRDAMESSELPVQLRMEKKKPVRALYTPFEACFLLSVPTQRSPTLPLGLLCFFLLWTFKRPSLTL